MLPTISDNHYRCAVPISLGSQPLCYQDQILCQRGLAGLCRQSARRLSACNLYFHRETRCSGVSIRFLCGEHIPAFNDGGGRQHSRRLATTRHIVLSDANKFSGASCARFVRVKAVALDFTALPSHTARIFSSRIIQADDQPVSEVRGAAPTVQVKDPFDKLSVRSCKFGSAHLERFINNPFANVSTVTSRSLVAEAERLAENRPGVFFFYALSSSRTFSRPSLREPAHLSFSESDDVQRGSLLFLRSPAQKTQTNDEAFKSNLSNQATSSPIC